MIGTRSGLYVAALIPLLLTTGCPVDERDLHRVQGSSNVGGNGSDASAGSAGTGDAGAAGAAGAAGTGGAAQGGASGAGMAGNGGTGATGGNAGAGGKAMGGAAGAVGGGPGCPDLDKNGRGDCDETLVENPRFDSAVEGWTMDANLEPTWLDEDGLDEDGSGALSLANENYITDNDGLVIGGAWQCLPAMPGTTYLFLAQVRVPSIHPKSSAGIGVLFFDQAGCFGQPTPFTAPLFSATNGYAVSRAEAQAPAGAQSMRVRLVINKPFNIPAVSAVFDNVLVRVK